MRRGKGFIDLVFKADDDIVGKEATFLELAVEINKLYNSIQDDEAVIFFIKKNCILVGKRKKDCEDEILHKFTNFGFGKLFFSKVDGLDCIISDIADVPAYCHEAIHGNPKALRETTRHLVKVYKKMAERMEAQNESPMEVALIRRRADELLSYLKLNDDNFMEKIDTIVIEAPKTAKYKSKTSDDDAFIK